MRSLCLIALCGGLLLSGPALAEGRGRHVGSVIAGVATAIVPLVVGGVLLTQDRQQLRHDGLYLAEAGLAAAPFVSHAIAGEYRRGAAFTAAPLLCAMSMRALVALQPDIVEEATTESRVVFFALVSLSVAGATVGLIDSLLAPDRARARLRPGAGPGQVGLSLRGTL